MEDFLTTRQVLDILKVDRITIYRMLNDGRLRGTKIGQQWRFSRIDVERLLNGDKKDNMSGSSGDESNLPVHCLQAIQDLFSSVSQFSAVLVNPQGESITEISNPCRFCQIIHSNAGAADACRKSHASFVEQVEAGKTSFVCHAGLHYVGKPVHALGELIGLFLVGGYSLETSDSETKSLFLSQLGSNLGISGDSLMAALKQVNVLQPEQQQHLEAWSNSAASAFESILNERMGFAQRLKKIADLTQIS